MDNSIVSGISLGDTPITLLIKWMLTLTTVIVSDTNMLTISYCEIYSYAIANKIQRFDQDINTTIIGIASRYKHNNIFLYRRSPAASERTDEKRQGDSLNCVPYFCNQDWTYTRCSQTAKQSKVWKEIRRRWQHAQNRGVTSLRRDFGRTQNCATIDVTDRGSSQSAE